MLSPSKIQKDSPEGLINLFVDFLKDRIDKVKATDDAVKEFVKKEKRKKREMKVDSDLSEFLK